MAMSKQNQQLLMLSMMLASAYFIRLASADDSETRYYLNPTSDCDVQTIYKFFVKVMNDLACTEKASDFFDPIKSCDGIEITNPNITNSKKIKEVTNSYSCSAEGEEGYEEEFSVNQKFSIAVNNTGCEPFEICVKKNMSPINWEMIIIGILIGIGSITVCILVVVATSYICRAINRRGYEKIADPTPQAPKKKEEYEAIEVSDSSPAPSMRYKQAGLLTKLSAFFAACCFGEEPTKTSIKIVTETGEDFPKYIKAGQTTATSSDIENQQSVTTPAQQHDEESQTSVTMSSQQ